LSTNTSMTGRQAPLSRDEVGSGKTIFRQISFHGAAPMGSLANQQSTGALILCGDLWPLPVSTTSKRPHG
jgi:hypothetical protein